MCKVNVKDYISFATLDWFCVPVMKTTWSSCILLKYISEFYLLIFLEFLILVNERCGLYFSFYIGFFRF